MYISKKVNDYFKDPYRAFSVVELTIQAGTRIIKGKLFAVLLISILYCIKKFT